MGVTGMDLLERERFLGDLATLLGDVAARGGRTAVVSGEAGIGKTALVERFTERHRNRARVLWGGCDALFTPRTLGPLRDIAQQTEGPLRDLLDRDAPRTTIFSAFLTELQRPSPPTIAVFEDVHWADEATLDFVKFLGRRIHRTHTLLILTCRDDELGPRHPLRTVLGDLPSTAATRLHLPPLSVAAVARLARAAGRSAEGLHAATSGNPFFVTEVLASGESGVPPTVRDAVLARAARLSPAARDLVDLAAVIPTKVERWLLDDTLAPTSTVFDECIEAGMLTGDEGTGTLSFRHELARRALEDALPPGLRQALHARVLRVLENRPAASVDVARLVHHASHADYGASVLRFAPMAARQASTLGAHRQAAAHYETALRHASALDAEGRAVLLEGRSYECYLTGQLEAALGARETALLIWTQLAHKEREGDTLRWLSRLCSQLARNSEAERHASHAIEVLEGVPPGSELAMAYSNRAQLHMLANENTEAVRWGMRAIELARALNDHETLVHALTNVGTAEYSTGDERGRAKLEESLRLALEHAFEEHTARAFGNLATESARQRDFGRAARYLSDGIAYCTTDRDLDPYAASMRSTGARVSLDKGLWAEAVHQATAVLDTPGLFPIGRLKALTVLGVARVRQGEPGASALLYQARDLAKGTGELQRIAPVAAALAEAAWLRADLERTLTEARDAFELASGKSHPWFLGELAFWMWRGRGLHKPPPGIATPFGVQIAGDWRAAAELWERIGCPYERAMALLDGDEEAQRTALAIFERLGAAPAAEIVRRRLRMLGARGVPRGPRSTTKSNPGGLTTRELEILGLLVEGMSTPKIAKRLFVSPKTIDNHVSTLLAKLDVHSRAEAVAAAYKRGIMQANKVTTDP